MTIWTKTELQTLDYSFNGFPMCNVEAKTLNTLSLDYSFNGFPFVGPGPAVAARRLIFCE